MHACLYVRACVCHVHVARHLRRPTTVLSLVLLTRPAPLPPTRNTFYFFALPACAATIVLFGGARFVDTSTRAQAPLSKQ